MDQPQVPHCKYNDATERCAFNPDPSALQDDPVCYKTDKNRCAVKKKKMIKIKPKKPSNKLVIPMENVVPAPVPIAENVGSENVGVDFLYPDLNDKNFNLKIYEKKEFYDTRNTV
jgi:hypothetical protein